MSYTFDGATKRITLPAGMVTLDLEDLFSRWKDWVRAGNAECLIAFATVGGEITEIPLYLFLQNGWLIVPHSANHVLNVVNGVLIGTAGGEPFTDPVGSFKIRINRQTPGIAIGYSTSGGSGPSAADIAAAVRADLAAELAQLTKVSKIHGVGVPLVVSPTTRTAGDLVQSITTVGDTTTVSAV